MTTKGHGIQIKWQDGRETEHWYESLAKWKEQASYAQFFGAKVRFWCESPERQCWSKWSR